MDTTSYLKAWICFFLVAIFGGLAASFAVGFLAGIIFAALGLEIEAYTLIFKGLGFVVGMVVSFLAYRWSVEKFILDPMVKDIQPTDEKNLLR